MELKDPRAGNASVRRYYLAPAVTTAGPREAEALYLLMKIAGGGGTSRLYQSLVVQDKVASSAGGWYSGMSLDSGSIGLYAVAAEGVPLDKVEQAMDRVLHEVREKGVTQAELDRAKKQFLAEFVYESDSQESLARRYGSGLALGLTVEEIDRWPETIAQVTLDDVKQAAAKHLDIRRSVTGTLVPVNPEPESPTAVPGSGRQRAGPGGAKPGRHDDRALEAPRCVRGAVSAPWAARRWRSPSEAQAMKVQEVKSPGGISAWLVEAHSVPLIAMRFAFEAAAARRTRRARRASPTSSPACSTRARATSSPSSSRSAWRRSPCA